MHLSKKKRLKRAKATRMKIRELGVSRLTVTRTPRHIYAQVTSAEGDKVLAQASGKKLTLQLGFSHPVEYEVPEGINLEAPSQTEIVISGRDKQQVGQVCAEIRSFRPPEPYKGKGVRYSGERVRRKEAKKK